MEAISYLPSAYVRRQREYVHPAIAISVPFMFLLCMHAIVHAAIPVLSLPSEFFLPALLLVGAEATLVGNILTRERLDMFARLRELLIVLAAMYLVLTAISDIRTGTLLPDQTTLAYPLCLVFLQWTLTAIVHVRLRDRELILTVLVGKSGEAMLHTLRDASLQAGSSLKGLRRIALLVWTLQGIIFVTLLAALFKDSPISGWGYAICGLDSLFGFLVLGIVHSFESDQILLGEGVVVPGGLQVERLTVACVVVAVGIPLALLGSRNDAPLPLSLITWLLARIAALFPLEPGQLAAGGLGDILQAQLNYQRQLASSVPVIHINPLVFLLVESSGGLL